MLIFDRLPDVYVKTKYPEPKPIEFSLKLIPVVIGVGEDYKVIPNIALVRGGGSNSAIKVYEIYYPTNQDGEYVIQLHYLPIIDPQTLQETDNPNVVKVYVNGVEKRVKSIDNEEGKIYLVSPVFLGDKVVIEYYTDSFDEYREDDIYQEYLRQKNLDKDYYEFQTSRVPIVKGDNGGVITNNPIYVEIRIEKSSGEVISINPDEVDGYNGIVKVEKQKLDNYYPFVSLKVAYYYNHILNYKDLLPYKLDGILKVGNEPDTSHYVEGKDYDLSEDGRYIHWGYNIDIYSEKDKDLTLKLKQYASTKEGNEANISLNVAKVYFGDEVNEVEPGSYLYRFSLKKPNLIGNIQGLKELARFNFIYNDTNGFIGGVGKKVEDRIFIYDIEKVEEDEFGNINVYVRGGDILDFVYGLVYISNFDINIDNSFEVEFKYEGGKLKYKAEDGNYYDIWNLDFENLDIKYAIDETNTASLNNIEVKYFGINPVKFISNDFNSLEFNTDDLSISNEYSITDGGNSINIKFISGEKDINILGGSKTGKAKVRAIFEEKDTEKKAYITLIIENEGRIIGILSLKGEFSDTLSLDNRKIIFNFSINNNPNLLHYLGIKFKNINTLISLLEENNEFKFKFNVLSGLEPTADTTYYITGYQYKTDEDYYTLKLYTYEDYTSGRLENEIGEVNIYNTASLGAKYVLENNKDRVFILEVKRDKNGNWESEAIRKIKDALINAKPQYGSIPYYLIPATNDFSVVRELDSFVNVISKEKYKKWSVVVWGGYHNTNINTIKNYAKQISYRTWITVPFSPIVDIKGDEALADGYITACVYAGMKSYYRSPFVSVMNKKPFYYIEFRDKYSNEELLDLMNTGVVAFCYDLLGSEEVFYVRFELTNRLTDKFLRHTYLISVSDEAMYRLLYALQLVRPSIDNTLTSNEIIKLGQDSIVRNVIDYYRELNACEDYGAVKGYRKSDIIYAFVIEKIKFRKAPFYIDVEVDIEV